MERQVICLRDFRKDGLIFCKGCTYRVNYNPVDGRLYIYTVWGYTDIPKKMLDINFF